MSIPSMLTSASRRAPLKLALFDRLGAGVVAAGCLAVLSAAAWVQPASEGYGTHTQLGLSDCQWAVNLSKPCPTCGMTTSFAWMVRGQPLEAFWTQPFGAVAAVLTAVVFWIVLHSAATGSRSAAVLAARVLRPGILLPAGAVFLAAWGYKVFSWTG
jgi:hypothetical protein